MKLRNWALGTATTIGLAFLAWLALSTLGHAGSITALERDQVHIGTALEKIDHRLDRIDGRLEKALERR
jgi:hypothetical protein